MIEAKPSRWALFTFDIYIKRLLKRHFFRLNMLGEIPDVDPALPLILTPNHSTWWDGFFVYILNQKYYNRPFYLMMLERQLAKYSFFSRLGAYSIDQKRPKKVIESLSYTVELLNRQTENPPVVCIFPQGILLPWSTRPIVFQKGLDWIIRKYEKTINVLPLAMRAEYTGEQNAEVFFLFGKNQIIETGNFWGTKQLAKIEEDLLDELQDRMLRQEDSVDLLKGKSSINTKWDHVRHGSRKDDS
ncbi:MAG: lysophospholipid acyltransferase family protein [candidate division KSB1 bacterium]|jgi:hypothetical protein|nr:lysophospholipid acyltransferase family protein [candidate division KSB1 bacterium]